MLITKVELENIKSYRSAKIALRPGTTAIRGENGAGKTTVVEAIGWALFDYLPYNQAKFVREGERSGQVAVSFVAKDDMEYTAVRRCGTSASWYIFDQRLESRVAEQKADVLAWLKEHLPLEGDLEPSDFFSDALGVPQGTFTSAFLAAAASRKRTFDALLQVEVYRKASDKLRETASYLDKEASRLDARIAGLEAETGNIEALRAELERLRQDEHVTSGLLVRAQTERDEARQRLDALRQLEAEVARLDHERRRQADALQQAREALKQAEEALEEAAAAQRVLYASAGDHTRFQEAMAGLQQARLLQAEQRPLLARQQLYKEELTKAKTNANNAESRLAQAEEARRQMDVLAPEVQVQTTLEQERGALIEQVRRLGEVQRQLAQLEQEHAKRAAEALDLARQIAAIETHRPEAALLSERRLEVEVLKLEAQRRDDWTRELGQVRDSVRGLQPRRVKTDAEVIKHQENVAKLLDARPLVETLPALEAEWNELLQQMMLLQGNIKRHNESKLQSAGGHCPFLREPCLNIQQKGLSSLEMYFDGLIARDQAAIVPLEAKQGELEEQVQDVRKKKSYVDRLEEFEQHLRDAQERQEQERQESDRLAERVRELEVLLGGAGNLRERLAAAQALLAKCEEADKQVSRLADLARQHAGLQAQLETQIQQRDALQTERDALLEAPAREAAVAEQLGALGDPRRAYTQQESIAVQGSNASSQLEAARQLIAQAEGALAALEVELAPYVGLEARIEALNHQQEQSRAGYQAYLANQQMAGKLPERQAAQSAKQANEQQARENHAAAAQRYEETAKGFDAGAVKLADEESVRLSNLEVALRGDFGRIHEDIEKQGERIRVAEEKRAELEAVRSEQQDINESHRMLQQFREIIKEAGPSIMKERLRQISREANRIFGDILGDRSAELAWEDDYEIVLYSRGQTRSFAQLSGGEQMSAALAVRLALLKVLSRLDIAFFDEPTQNMDETRRTNLAEQMRRVKGFNQLIVISHDDTFEQGLDSFVYVQKQGGETTVQAEGLGEEAPALVGSASEDGW